MKAEVKQNLYLAGMVRSAIQQRLRNQGSRRVVAAKWQTVTYRLTKKREDMLTVSNIPARLAMSLEC